MIGLAGRLGTSIVATGLACGCGRIGFDARADGAQLADSAPPSTCPTLPGVLLCDGFEGTLAQWQSMIEINGTVSIDDTRAYRGTHSLHGHGVATGTNEQVHALIVQETILPTMPTSLFIRAYVYAPAPPSGDQLSWATLSQSVPPYLGLTFDYADMNTHPLFYNSTTGTAVTTNSTTTLPFGTWTCVDWQVDVSATAANGQLDAFVSDSEITELAVHEQTESNPAMQNLEIGLFLPDTMVAHQPYDLWVDEVIISSTYIDCAQ
jgi:hypothetical protein